MDAPQRKYLPTFADLIDRLSICQLKQILLPEGTEEYRKEIDDIIYDLDILVQEKSVIPTGRMIRAILLIMLSNRVIWENESKARQGGPEQDRFLKFTHSINGVRNNAKNIISQELGERVDLKTDCFASDLPAEFGRWNIFPTKK